MLYGPVDVSIQETRVHGPGDAKSERRTQLRHVCPREARLLSKGRPCRHHVVVDVSRAETTMPGPPVGRVMHRAHQRTTPYHRQESSPYISYPWTHIHWVEARLRGCAALPRVMVVRLDAISTRNPDFQTNSSSTRVHRSQDHCYSPIVLGTNLKSSLSSLDMTLRHGTMCTWRRTNPCRGANIIPSQPHGGHIYPKEVPGTGINGSFTPGFRSQYMDLVKQRLAAPPCQDAARRTLFRHMVLPEPLYEQSRFQSIPKKIPKLPAARPPFPSRCVSLQFSPG